MQMTRIRFELLVLCLCFFAFGFSVSEDHPIDKIWRSVSEDPVSRDRPPDENTGARSKEPPRRTRHSILSRSRALEMEQLRSLGYVDGSYDENAHLKGVVFHDEARAYQGYNLYSSRNQEAAQLIDMEGRVVHQWQSPGSGRWQHVELLPKGHLLVIVKDEKLMCLDKDSETLWSLPGRFHHDLSLYEENIYVLSRVVEHAESVHPATPTLIDEIWVLSRNGTLKRRVSMLEILQNSPYAFLFPSVQHVEFSSPSRADGNELDILHTNHIEVFDGHLAHRGPLYEEGNMLVSMRSMNAIAVINGASLEILWLWGPSNLALQHHPTVLENGNILLFDNGFEQSRILEIDPQTNQIVWSYGPNGSFFSRTRGSNQRLPNGNTLITESDSGYVFEVTQTGETVWKFANPIVDEDTSVREAIWRMKRFDPAELPWLE